MPWIINLTEERGPSHDIRTPIDFPVLFLTNTISWDLNPELRKLEFWEDNAKGWALEDQQIKDNKTGDEDEDEEEQEEKRGWWLKCKFGDASIVAISAKNRWR